MRLWVKAYSWSYVSVHMFSTSTGHNLFLNLPLQSIVGIQWSLISIYYDSFIFLSTTYIWLRTAFVICAVWAAELPRSYLDGWGDFNDVKHNAMKELWSGIENEHRAIWLSSSVFECVTGFPWILMGVLKQTDHMSLCPLDVCPQDKFCCMYVSWATENTATQSLIKFYPAVEVLAEISHMVVDVPLCNSYADFFFVTHHISNQFLIWTLMNLHVLHCKLNISVKASA